MTATDLTDEPLIPHFADIVPPAPLHELKRNSVLHEEVVLLIIDTEDVPRMRSERRVDIASLGNGLHRVHARYGFVVHGAGGGDWACISNSGHWRIL